MSLGICGQKQSFSVCEAARRQRIMVVLPDMMALDVSNGWASWVMALNY